MTREDAIYWIKNLAVLSTEKDMPQIKEALNMAIEALADRTTEPSGYNLLPVEDEPQYDIDKGTIRCDNCSENGSYKCSKCDGEMYFKRLEVEDEPQTDCAWR